MDTDKPRIETDVAVQILWTTATAGGIVVLGLFVLAGVIFVLVSLLGGPPPSPLQLLLSMMLGWSQLFAVGVMAAAVFSVAGPFPKPWEISFDAWVLIGLVAVLCGVGLLSCGPPYSRVPGTGLRAVLAGETIALWRWFNGLPPWALYGFCGALAASAVGLWAWIRMREEWRWPGASKGHILAAGAIFVYGGLVTALIALESWLAGLGFAAVFGYGVCYALGVVTFRTDEFEAACRPDAEPRALPSVRFTTLLLALSFGCSGVPAWGLVEQLLHRPLPIS